MTTAPPQPNEPTGARAHSASETNREAQHPMPRSIRTVLAAALAVLTVAAALVTADAVPASAATLNAVATIASAGDDQGPPQRGLGHPVHRGPPGQRRLHG